MQLEQGVLSGLIQKAIDEGRDVTITISRPSVYGLGKMVLPPEWEDAITSNAR